MSARLPVGVQTFPTICTNGLIKILLGSYELVVETPYEEDYPLDISTYIGTNLILCYLENDEHKLVVRRDGTLSRYTKENILINNIHIELPTVLKEIELLQKGTFAVSGETVLNEWYKIPEHDAFLLGGKPFYGFFEVPMKLNVELMKTLTSPLMFEPVLSFNRLINQDATFKSYQLNLVDKSLGGEFPIVSTYYDIVRKVWIS